MASHLGFISWLTAHTHSFSAKKWDSVYYCVLAYHALSCQCGILVYFLPLNVHVMKRFPSQPASQVARQHSMQGTISTLSCQSLTTKQVNCGSSTSLRDHCQHLINADGRETINTTWPTPFARSLFAYCEVEGEEMSSADYFDVLRCAYSSYILWLIRKRNSGKNTSGITLTRICTLQAILKIYE